MLRLVRAKAAAPSDPPGPGRRWYINLPSLRDETSNREVKEFLFKSEGGIEKAPSHLRSLCLQSRYLGQEPICALLLPSLTLSDLQFGIRER